MCGTSNHELPLVQASNGCACCSPQQGAGNQPAARQESGLPAAQFQVAGMTCGHCVSSVSEELGRLEGVSDVQVALVPGGSSTVTIYGSEKPAPEAVRAAVAEAGYELTSTV
ncbi:MULTISPECIES: heavy-metal-associated domain-containing protein [Micrococcaceae]|jgi:copper chaperone CopZ|uniref:HMA domain-containing protein n=3 Tax=Micrococcaceae TaxID=1268 RepID=Q6SK48_PAEAU|nr:MULTISPECIES: cation transporter [Micrococcaceae]AAS20124.1 hypothetical protein [Paenarthrobacter aurescens]ABM10373.1 COP associated protein (Copper ion binding protein) [Paenarthrobacter aurescens TC1]SDQ03413.1 Copper chaperone CopZ [Arthrobacter crystallopoietes]